MRLCLRKYVKNQYSGPNVKITTGMALMFDEFLEPAFKQFETQTWRKERLWKEEVDYVLKVSLPTLKDIYRKFSGKIAMPGAPKYMCCLEFEQLITEANVLSDKFGVKQLSILFNLSMMTQVDEVESERHINMTFVEFLEALVRVAERLEIPNLMRDEGSFIGKELSPEEAEEYAERPLHQKVESLILFLAKQNLKAAEYQRHCLTLKEYQAEKDIWANDIDTGPLVLQ